MNECAFEFVVLGRIPVLGPQYAHSLLMNRFGSDGEPTLRLLARAKQFSW